MKNVETRRIRLAADVSEPLTLLYLSDFHFRARSGPAAAWMLERIYELRPDLVLLGGDYMDTRGGWAVLDDFLGGLPHPGRYLAVAGNHDYWRRTSRLVELLREHGVHWIEEASYALTIGATRLRVDGNKVSSAPGSTDLHILCAHDPKLFDRGLSSYDLALAGHLHGSQVVFWQNARGLYPGRLFYRWNVLDARVDGCTCLVSKGLGDTLPVRYNCPKDVIFVEIHPRP